ncbi:TonB-dependent receptor [Janthinobacterium psychrotolerans]|uniref:Iron complex outermembrane recepter protein n=1 Tax=Janthinobacterium psychrotolerans TaxID=1747903 RepID=A0A1A7C173_9BURK|nr:TonB-dependent siderophore receptor [Janthinobacterium psychrotolerans]OBV39676.1 iron complex outermembrane recepter protein [Janthinobacterium psychrotolerans]
MPIKQTDPGFSRSTHTLALAAMLGACLAPQARAQTSAEAQPDLPMVRVNGQSEPDLGGQIAKSARAGLLGEKNLLDTPFSVSSYTSERMLDQQALTLAEVLGGDASTRFTGQIGGVTDSFFIRGFPLNEGNLSEVAFDGVYGVSPNYHLFTEYLESVEVLKGPAALLYGMSPNGGVGGVVNAVPKRSLPRDLTRLTLDYGSDTQLGAALDVSRRFGAERRFGVRVNGLHRQGRTPLDHQRSRAEVAAVALDYRGSRLRASFDLIEQYQWIDAPTRPFLVAARLPVPQAPDGRRNITQSWGWWKSSDLAALGKLEYDLDDNISVFLDAGGTRSDVLRYSDQTPTITTAAGDMTVTPMNWKFRVRRASGDTGVRARFRSGEIQHALVVMGNIYRDEFGSISQAGKLITSNIHAPVAVADPGVPAPGRTPKLSASTLSSLAVADTLGMLDGRVQLTLGMRRQLVESKNYNAASGALQTRYKQGALTPLAGLVVKPWRHVSLYGNYIEGLSKGDIAPNIASNAGQVFAPYKSRQHELGAKADMGEVLATIALFQVSKPSGQLYGSVYRMDSEQRNRGLELNLSGAASKTVRLLAGLTVLDARLVRTNSAATIDKRPVGVPAVMANLGAQWDLPALPGLTASAAISYTGKQYVDQGNVQSVPSWAKADLGLRYRTAIAGKATTLRAGLMNAFDRHYWAGVASYGTISQSAPRTVQLSAAFDL